MPVDKASVIVIGAGPIGLHVAVQIGRAGHHPVVIDTLPFTGGQCAALYPDGVIFDTPGHREIGAAALVDDLKLQLQPLEPLFLLSRRVRSIWGSLESGFNVETDTGETITGAAVIHAGGAGALRPRALHVEGVEAVRGGVSYLPSDAAAAAGKRVAVFGDNETAIEVALDAATRAKSVSLIHSAPLRAGAARMGALTRAAAARRLTLIHGDLSRLHAADGRLSRIEILVGGADQAHDVDLLLVQAGLEYASDTITGLADIKDAMTGETETPGLFIVGDAVPSASRPPLIVAGFSEALRAAEAAHRRIAPNAPASLPRALPSPAPQFRLNVA